MKIRVLDNDIELPDFDPPKFGARPVLMVVAVVFGLAMLWSTVYQIAPEEAGVVLSHGKWQFSEGSNIKYI